MERPHRMGAGPESTGAGSEQLDLFTAQHHEQAIIDNHVVAEPTLGIGEAEMPQRAHFLGHRSDRLHTSDHIGVRGDRLEGTCWRRPDWSN